MNPKKVMKISNHLVRILVPSNPTGVGGRKGGNAPLVKSGTMAKSWLRKLRCGKTSLIPSEPSGRRTWRTRRRRSSCCKLRCSESSSGRLARLPAGQQEEGGGEKGERGIPCG